MSGPWEKYAAAEAPPADAGKPWEKFTAGASPPAPEMTWGQVGSEALKNAPHSAWEAVKALVHPITHPVETVQGLGKLLGGAATYYSDPETEFGVLQAELMNPGSTDDLRKAQKKAQETYGEPVRALGKLYKERYGSEDAIKNTLATDPVGMAMDLSMILGGAGAAGLRVPKIAKLADPVAVASKTLKTGAKVGEGVASHTLGHLTGGGPEAIREAVKAGYARDLNFIKALEGDLPMEEVVKLAGKAVSNMRQERNANYRTLMETVKKNGEQIEPSKIMQGWQDSQKYGHLEGTDFATTERSAGLDKKLMDVLEEWYQKGQVQPDKFYTPGGLDALKKRIRSIKDNIGFDKREDRAYIGSLEKFIKDQITEQAPVYEKVMKEYAQATEGLEEIERALSLGDRATYDTGIRKLLSAMRNNANSNYGNRLRMVDTLEKHGADGLKARLAGSQLSSAMPRGLSGRNPMMTVLGGVLGGEPGLLGALPFESPKLVGKGAYSIGSGSRELRDLLKGTIIPDESVTRHLPSNENLARILYQMGMTNGQAGPPEH